MLETIPNGVATLDADRRIVLTNRALSEMMDPGGQRPFLGRVIEEVFPPEVADVLDRLIKRSHRMGSASSEIEMTGSVNDKFGGSLNLLATVALLETPGKADRMRREHRGYVLVLENATELLRAQKQSAWKEVARRVAHEIKNPLTPIGLCAEQIRRHIDRLATTLAEHDVESPSPAVIRRCSEVISSSVESMRSLVDQFSALAEFPTAQPRPADLNTIVENSLALFAGRMQNITHRQARWPPAFRSCWPIPKPSSALSATSSTTPPKPCSRASSANSASRTALLENGMVELTISDTGPGLTDEMRERLFLPYFSTKQRGTGLGLAIAAKIIQEHQGTIRAEKNIPAGAQVHHRTEAATAADHELELAQRRPIAAANWQRRHCYESRPHRRRRSRDPRIARRDPARRGLPRHHQPPPRPRPSNCSRDAAYDVVLLDIWLPDRDGLDVLAEIRTLDRANVPEVVIISGHGTIEAAVRATKLGAYDFLEKPLSLDRTLIVLKNAMKARQTAQRQSGVHAPAR